MSNVVNKNPGYCHHKPSGQAIVRIGGVMHYLGKWKSAASKANYDRLIGEWLAAGRQVSGKSDLTVSELIARYWTFAQGYYRKPDGSPTLECANYKPALAMLKRIYGPTLASEFGPLALKTLRLKMIEAGWARTYCNAQTSRIKSVFKWGVAEQLIEPTNYQALTALPGLKAGRCEARESEPIKPVDVAVVNKTLPHLSSVVVAMIRLQLLSGARPGEICSMRTADIDTSGSVWLYKPASHKTAHHGHEWVIFIGPKAQDVLRPFLKPLNPQAYTFSPKDAVAEHRDQMHTARLASGTPLSCGNRPGTNRRAKPKWAPGDCYDTASYRRAIARASKVAGVTSWHPHQLRHTAATEFRRQFSIEAAQVMLGQANFGI